MSAFETLFVVFMIFTIPGLFFFRKRVWFGGFTCMMFSGLIYYTVICHPERLFIYY